MSRVSSQIGGKRGTLSLLHGPPQPVPPLRHVELDARDGVGKVPRLDFPLRENHARVLVVDLARHRELELDLRLRRTKKRLNAVLREKFRRGILKGVRRNISHTLNKQRYEISRVRGK